MPQVLDSARIPKVSNKFAEMYQGSPFNELGSSLVPSLTTYRFPLGVSEDKPRPILACTDLLRLSRTSDNCKGDARFTFEALAPQYRESASVYRRQLVSSSLMAASSFGNLALGVLDGQKALLSCCTQVSSRRTQFPTFKPVAIMGRRYSSVARTGLRERFTVLRNQWKAETRYLSSITAKSMHPAYQAIVGMGGDAIALILQDLEKQPDHWFWALKAITGEDPVPKEERGSVRAMARAWVAWGHDMGYLE